MSTITGEWTPSSTASKRMRLRLVYTVSVSGATGSITADLYVDAGYSISDSNNSLSWSGAFGSGSSSQQVTPATNGSQRLKSWSKSVALTGAQQSLPFSASLSGIEYVGSTASISGGIIVPARQVTSPPPAPTGVALAHVSGQRFQASWTHSGAGVDRFELQGRYLDGAWYALAQASSSARNLTINGVRNNDKYAVQVRAVNAAGASSWAPSSFQRSLPAAATGVVAYRDGAELVVEWVNQARFADRIDVQWQSSSDSGASWSAWANAAAGLAATATSTRLTSEVGLTYRVRVQTIVSVGPESVHQLVTDSQPSAAVQPQTAPAAPTLLAPGAYVDSAESPLVLRWRHNSLDGSPQTSAEVQLRPVDSSATTLTSTTAQQVSTPMRPLGAYEWRARTRGSAADYGDWSSWSRFTITAAPSVSITSPAQGAALSAAQVQVQWEFSDPSGAYQRLAVVRLSDDSGVLAQRQVGDVRQLLLPTTLTNGGSYTVTVQATSGTNLVSDVASVSFTVRFTPPSTPDLLASWNKDSGTVEVIVTNPDGGEVVVENRIERSLDGGATWELVGTTSPGGGLQDWTVPLGVSGLWRAVAVTELGASSASAPVEVTTPRDGLWLRSADGVGVLVQYNLELDHDAGHEVETVTYLGHALPTAHHGLGRPETLSISGAQIPEEDMDRIRVILGGNVWMRDPAGRAWWAVLTSSISTRQTQPRWRSISLTLTRIEAPGE